MQLQLDKCTVLRVTNKKKTIDAKYQLYGHTLESVTSAKYLGLTITNKLQWDQYINYITSKASKTLGFLRRNLKFPSIRIKEQAYFTLARQLVEYASTVRDPYTQTDIPKVEAVQRRATRYVANNHSFTSCCLCISLYSQCLCVCLSPKNNIYFVSWSIPYYFCYQ